MEPRRVLLDLGVQHQVTPQALRRILSDPRVAAPPVRSSFWMRHGAGLAGAVLFTFGIVFWVAANWATVPHLGQVLLLQALVAVPGVSAVQLPRASAPFALASMGAVVGLLAYHSQSWQAGLHGWRILAWWAAICLALALAVRRDVVWLAWGLGATSAIGWWLTGRLLDDSSGGLADDGGTGWSRGFSAGYLLLACAWLVLVLLVVSPWARRLTGAGGNAYRATGTAATMVLTAGALVAPLTSSAFVAGLVVIAALALLLSLRRWFDVTLLSATLLGLFVLVERGLTEMWWDGYTSGSPQTGGLLAAGLFSIGLLAAAVTLVVQRQRTLAAARGRESPRLSPAAPGDSRRGGGSPNAGPPGPDTQWYAATVRRAVDAGDLPETALADSARTTSDGPISWPIAVLQAVGGLLSAVMVVGMVTVSLIWPLVMMLGTSHVTWWYAASLLITAFCVGALRKPRLPVFLQSGALSLLVAGLATAHTLLRALLDQAGSFRWGDFLPDAASLGMLLLAAALIERTWMRWILAAGSGGLSAFLVLELNADPRGTWVDPIAGDRIAVQAAVLLGLAILVGHHLSVAAQWPVRFSSALDAIGAGWLVGVATVACFTADAHSWWPGEGSRVSGLASALAATSALLVLAAAATAWITWPILRGPMLVTATATAVAVAWFIPQAGPIAAAATAAALTRRFALGATLAAATLTVVGWSFWDYQQSLGVKGLILSGAGVVLGIGALLTGLFRRHDNLTRTPSPQPDTAATPTATPPGDRDFVPAHSHPPARLGRTALAAVTVAAALTVSGIDEYQSEHVTVGSEVYYLRLAQSDPREPLLGDYVALRYQLPPGVGLRLSDWRSETEPTLTARIGTGGELDIVDLLDPGASTPTGSVRIRCVHGTSGWQPGPDSWFITEGTGKRYENAVLARVRLDPDGTVHLLGLADDHHTTLPVP